MIFYDIHDRLTHCLQGVVISAGDSDESNSFINMSAADESNLTNSEVGLEVLSSLLQEQTCR